MAVRLHGTRPVAISQVCLLQALGAQKKYVASYQVPYLVHRDLWVAYEDRDSLTAKVSVG